MRVLYSLLLCAGAGSALAAPPPAATLAPAPATSIATLATVTVSGVQPGPGLWKVSRGDHVLWVLGTVRHLPRDMQWQSAQVERTLAQSQELIEPPSLKLDAKVGFFGKLLLLPAAYGARKNPNGRTLQQVLPPSIYARWRVLRQRYLGHAWGIERWRPIFAAIKLEHAAVKAHGLRSSGAVESRVRALARQHGLKRTATDYRITIDNPRQAIHAFEQGGPHDITCFARTLQNVSRDLPAMGARANAWAVGDLAALRAMPQSHYREACAEALGSAGFARELGIGDVTAIMREHWLRAARAALARNRQSFALLPMNDLLSDHGLLAELGRQGYVVVAPDADEVEGGQPAHAGPGAAAGHRSSARLSAGP